MSQVKNTNLAQTIAKIYYAFVSEIDSINQGTTKKHKTVTFVSGAAWRSLYFSPGSANYSEPGKDTNAGKIYEQKLSAFYPGEDEGNVFNFTILENRPIVVKIVYSSGQVKIMGNKTNYAELSDNLNINQKTGHSIIITRTDFDKAFWLEES